jgi:hypothetical protein
MTLPAPTCENATTSLASLDVDDLLLIMEAHGSGRASETHPPVLAIASALAQYLGIHCERYLAVIVEATAPHEWRGLFAFMGRGPARHG